MANDQTLYSLHNNKKYVTSVDKAYLAKYIDPLTLNFKLLIDFDRTSGLIANEKYENSALAYLKRIGDELRYEQLKNWISVLQILNKEYDFLLLNVEGLDTIKNAKPYDSFNEEEDKLTLTFRETSDMLVESLIETYRHLFFDDIRCVEVLPSNLRKFDISILVFSGGYFNTFLYDDNDEENPDVEKIIFPTKRKLSDTTFKNPLSAKYNHLLFNMNSCSIDITESGKTFLENVSNEPGGDMTKNNLVITYKFAGYKGRFNNIMGDIDFVGLLALMAAQNKISNSSEAPEKLKTKLKDQIKDSWKSLKSSTMKTLEAKKDNQLKKVLSSNSVIGDVISKFSVKNAEMMIKNTLDLGINFVEDSLINEPLTKINNLLFQNFSNNLIDIYKNNFDTNMQNNNIKLLENNETSQSVTGRFYSPEQRDNVERGISLRNENIYNRTGF